MDRYEVKNTDTLEGIAASHDCTVGELVKLNKLHSRMVIWIFIEKIVNFFPNLGLSRAENPCPQLSG